MCCAELSDVNLNIKDDCISFDSWVFRIIRTTNWRLVNASSFPVWMEYLPARDLNLLTKHASVSFWLRVQNCISWSSETSLWTSSVGKSLAITSITFSNNIHQFGSAKPLSRVISPNTSASSKRSWAREFRSSEIESPTVSRILFSFILFFAKLFNFLIHLLRDIWYQILTYDAVQGVLPL